MTTRLLKCYLVRTFVSGYELFLIVFVRNPKKKNDQLIRIIANLVFTNPPLFTKFAACFDLLNTDFFLRIKIYKKKIYRKRPIFLRTKQLKDARFMKLFDD